MSLPLNSAWLRRGVLALFVLIAAACQSTPVAPEIVRVSSVQNAPNIVVLKSGKNDFVTRPATAFVENTLGNVAVFTLTKNMSTRSLVNTLKARKPDLILALGTRAAVMASKHFANTPILFAMVMNYQRHGFQNKPNMAGIAVELAPAMEFLQYRIVVPELRRVVAFHGKNAVPTFAKDASEQLKMLGIELVLAPVRSFRDLRSQVGDFLTKVDAVWFINDPVVGTKEAFAFLRDTASKQNKPLIASISDQFAEAGALMSVSVDIDAVGAQAASMVQQILSENRSTQEMGIRPPMASRLTVNLESAETISLTVSPDTIPHINRLIGSE